MAAETGTQLEVRFLPEPFSFVPVTGLTPIWEAPERGERGVYLWCVEHGDAFLVRYVGATLGADAGDGGETRVDTELTGWRRGRPNVAISLDAMLRGTRVHMPRAKDADEDLEVRALEPKYRILLAPLASDEACHQAERAIVATLRRHPFTAEALGQPAEDVEAPVSLRFVEAPAIIGLTAAVED